MGSPIHPRGFVFVLGRFLQALGLVLLPVGLYHGVVRGEGMTTELTMLAAGAVAFLLGSALVRPYREG